MKSDEYDEKMLTSAKRRSKRTRVTAVTESCKVEASTDGVFFRKFNAGSHGNTGNEI